MWILWLQIKLDNWNERVQLTLMTVQIVDVLMAVLCPCYMDGITSKRTLPGVGDFSAFCFRFIVIRVIF